MITIEEADAMADALTEASKKSPVRQYRYELRRRAGEWTRVVRAMADLDEFGDEGAIELAGSLTNGMEMFYESELGHWTALVRVLQNGGQFSLHLEDPMGQRPGIYRNLFGPASPVVVRP